MIPCWSEGAAERLAKRAMAETRERIRRTRGRQDPSEPRYAFVRRRGAEDEYRFCYDACVVVVAVRPVAGARSRTLVHFEPRGDSEVFWTSAALRTLVHLAAPCRLGSLNGVSSWYSNADYVVNAAASFDMDLTGRAEDASLVRARASKREMAWTLKRLRLPFDAILLVRAYMDLDYVRWTEEDGHAYRYYYR